LSARHILFVRPTTSLVETLGAWPALAITVLNFAVYQRMIT
jgi:hypothetical protein